MERETERSAVDVRSRKYGDVDLWLLTVVQRFNRFNIVDEIHAGYAALPPGPPINKFYGSIEVKSAYTTAHTGIRRTRRKKISETKGKFYGSIQVKSAHPTAHTGISRTRPKIISETKQCSRRGSNPRPSAHKTNALTN
jgi:hypothetical protein